MRALRALIGTLIAVVLLVASPLAASAHSELISSSPADGEVLSSAPTFVTLQFNEQISAAGLQVVAQGPDGPITLGAPTLEGASVTVSWPQDVPAGAYRVAYRVVSADGHPIDGVIGFSFNAPAANDAPVDLGQSAVAEPEPATPTAATQPSEGFPWWVAVVAVIGGVGIGAAIARRMRARSTTGNDTL